MYTRLKLKRIKEMLCHVLSILSMVRISFEY